MPKNIPDRWREYDACNWIPIKDERIIAFKTPLSSKYDHEYPDDDGILETERFTPTDLVSRLAEKGFDLGIVIDFTFTKRYYDPQEFTQKGILYTKLMCPGHQIPGEKDVKRFKSEVHSFLNKNKNGSLIGVHCTHGVNRTGYMISRYLIDCQGYQPDDAIQAVHESRGYPIERGNYLEDLKSRTPGHGIERTDRPQWRQRDRNHQSSRDYRSFERNSYDYCGPSSWRDLQYEHPNHRPFQRTSSGASYLIPPSYFQTPPPNPPYGHRNSYFDNGHENDYYSSSHRYMPRGSYYDNSLRYCHYDNSQREYNYDSRNSYQRDNDYGHGRGFDNDYSRDYMSRSVQYYTENNRYQPYRTGGSYPNRGWQR